MLKFIVIYCLLGIVYLIASYFVSTRNEEEKQNLIKSWSDLKNSLMSDCDIYVNGIVGALVSLSYAVFIVCLVFVAWPWFMVVELLEKKTKQGEV